MYNITLSLVLALTVALLPTLQGRDGVRGRIEVRVRSNTWVWEASKKNAAATAKAYGNWLGVAMNTMRPTRSTFWIISIAWRIGLGL